MRTEEWSQVSNTQETLVQALYMEIRVRQTKGQSYIQEQRQLKMSPLHNNENWWEKEIRANIDGTPCEMKVACTVWSWGKAGDNFKGLPIAIKKE